MRFAFLLVILLTQFSATTAFTAAAPNTRNSRRKIRDLANNNVRPNASALHASSIVNISKKKSNMAVAGKLFPILKKFLIGPAKAKEIVAGVGSAVDVGDLILIAIFGWLLPPLSKLIYNRKHEGEEPAPDFQTSKLSKISTVVSQIAKIAGIVFCVDVLEISLDVIGIKFPFDISVKCAQVMYTIYAAWRLVPYKRYLIKKQVMAKSDPDDVKTKIKIYNTLCNIAIIVPTVFFLIDELKIPIGSALRSVFALGGVGTLVFSLASKDLSSQIVNGIALVSSNKYDEGDYILLGDGTAGTVVNMGWVSTDLRGGDEVIVKIPNSQLANQRLSNLSRIKRAQVKQTLWFSYEDLEKLPEVLANIKKEIGGSCASLITDGSRPFRVIWTDYKDDHLEVLVDCHFDHQPSTDVYWNTRQNVLLAIARAAKKADVQFDIPNVRVKTRNDTSTSNLQQQFGIEEQESSVDGASPNAAT